MSRYVHRIGQMLALWIIVQTPGCATEPDQVPPDAITSLSASIPSDGTVLLSWEECSSSDLAHYRVYQGEGGVFELEKDLILETSVQIVDLDPGIVYEFYVTAVDEAENESERSNIVSVQPNKEFPAAVRNLTLSVPGDGQIRLSWEPGIETDLTGYRIYESTDSLSFQDTGSDPADTLVVFTGLDITTQYFYRVTAVDNAANEGPPSEVVSGYPNITPPDPVTGLTAAPEDQCVELAWEASGAPDLAHYRIRQGLGGQTPVEIGLVSTEASCTVTDLENGSWYAFAVTAVDVAGNESAPCIPVEARPTSPAYETSLGWIEFESQSYGSALSYFQAATALDPDYADAHSGMGWSYLMGGDSGSSFACFDQANSLGLSTADAHAGLAIVYRDLPDLAEAIAEADTVLTQDPAYVFTHSTSVDHRDMRLIKAHCYYRLGAGYIALAQAEVDILDPSNGLDPDDPTTWIVAGVTYSSYGAALLKKIEELTRLYGG